MLFAKLVYTVVLAGILGIVAREIWTVWFDRRIYVGKFEIITDVGKDDAAGETFSKRIAASQAMLAQQISDYQSRRGVSSPIDSTFALTGQPPVDLPPKALGGVEITVQSINVGQILSTLRKYFVTPNEVRGTVTSSTGAVVTAVDWPNAPSIPNSNSRLDRFLVSAQPSELAAARMVAASIAWGQAAAADEQFAAYSRGQFCDFGMALAEFYARSAGSPPADIASVALLRSHAAQLKSHYGAPALFPEIYRLRADLLDLLPESARQINDLAEAQDDRLSYAMLSVQLKDLSPDIKRVAALAMARPAIQYTYKDGLVGTEENWKGLLSRRLNDIALIASATGVIRSITGDPIGTGFVVGPGLVMTVDHVFEAAKIHRGNSNSQPPSLSTNVGPTPCMDTMSGQCSTGRPAILENPTFCLGDDAKSCTETLELGKLVYDGRKEGSNIVIVSFKDDPLPPRKSAPLGQRLDLASVVGQYAYVVGYPQADPRLPDEFVTRLLKGKPGIKRLMPGRVVTYGWGTAGALELRAPAEAQPAKLVSDISTTSGVSGAPLVELATGKVVGVSFAGQWTDARGKFAISQIIPDGALKYLKLLQ
jgi:hypothetical protein